MWVGAACVILASLEPFANFAAANVGEDFSHARLLLYALITAAFGLLLGAIITSLSGRATRPRAFFTVSAFLFLLFAFSIVQNVTGTSTTTVLVVYGAVCVFICTGVWQLGNQAAFQRFWAVTLVLMLMLSAGSYAARSLELQSGEPSRNSVRIDDHAIGTTSAAIPADINRATIHDGASILGTQIERKRPYSTLQVHVTANAYSSQNITAVIAVFRTDEPQPVALESKPIAAGGRALFDLTFTVDAKRHIPVTFDVRVGTTGDGALTINGPDPDALPGKVPIPSISVTETELESPAATADRRNVYYLTLDSYPRADFLRRFFRYDNTPFISALNKRGFFVAQKSFSNYFGTYLSVSGTMEQQYVVDETDKNFWKRLPWFTAVLNGRNPVFKHFQKLGYFVAKLNFLEECPSDAFVDLCYLKKDHLYPWLGNGITDLEIALFQLTPGYALLQMVDPDFLKSRIALEEIGDVAHLVQLSRGHTPRFVYAHIWLPHLPYRFNADCGWSNTIFVDGNGNADPKRFLDQVQCANYQVIPLIDYILQDDPGAIILINSDHGSGLNVDWSLPYDRWPDSSVRERFGNLDAMRLPERCQSTFYDSITPVNYFELVFACIERRNPHFLEDRIYISTFDKSHPHYGQVWRYR